MPLLEKLHKCKVIIKSDSWRLNGPQSIKGFVPMYGPNNCINDVEIILNVKRNYYFSSSMFLEGKSWVKEIYFTDKKDKRIKKLPYLLNNRAKIMTPKHYEEANLILENLFKKSLEVRDEHYARCDGCESEFDTRTEGSIGIDNSICGKCLNRCNNIRD